MYGTSAQRVFRIILVLHTRNYGSTIILAGCPVGGTVLDLFSGSGTTGKVAHDLGREYIGIELNPAYAEASENESAPTYRHYYLRGSQNETHSHPLPPDIHIRCTYADRIKLVGNLKFPETPDGLTIYSGKYNHHQDLP